METYGGTGNVNLGLSWGTVPDPFDQWFDAFEEEGMVSGESSSLSKMAWDGGPGNDETVTLYDIEPGVYYITAFSFKRLLILLSKPVLLIRLKTSNRKMPLN